MRKASIPARKKFVPWNISRASTIVVFLRPRTPPELMSIHAVRASRGMSSGLEIFVRAGIPASNPDRLTMTGIHTSHISQEYFFEKAWGFILK